MLNNSMFIKKIGVLTLIALSLVSFSSQGSYLSGCNRCCSATKSSASKIEFWNTEQRGATIMNSKSITQSYLDELKKRGVKFIRLAPNKWEAAKRDFLIGDADRYTGIPEEDFAKLKESLDLCTQNGIKVVLVTLSLPGCRWRQHNGYTSDYRIYENPEFQRQAAQFYKDLATKLKGHPAIVGYNLLNEPHPGDDWSGMDKDG